MKQVAEDPENLQQELIGTLANTLEHDMLPLSLTNQLAVYTRNTDNPFRPILPVETSDISRTDCRVLKRSACMEATISGRSSSRPRKNHAGERYGAWTVLRYDSGTHSTWVCRCSCGTEKIQRIHNLIYGKSKSCGCGGSHSTPAKEFTLREFDGHSIRQRNSDGYFDATEMCKVSDKRLNNWMRNPATQELLASMASEARISATELVVVQKGGDPKIQGTWIYPDAAMHLAMWLSPKFAGLVCKWIRSVVEGRTATLSLQSTAVTSSVPPVTITESSSLLSCPEADALESLAGGLRELSTLEQWLEDAKEKVAAGRRSVFLTTGMQTGIEPLD